MSTALPWRPSSLPDNPDDLIRLYTFSDPDLALIHQHRGAANRLGFAIQLCCLRYPGVVLGAQEAPFPPLLRLVATQIQVPPESWDEYGASASRRGASTWWPGRRTRASCWPGR